MRLTRRGWGVLAVAVVGFLLAAGFGPRSLNAVVAPAAVALVADAFVVGRRPTPTVSRHLPAPGFPGEVRTVGLDVDCRGPHRVVESTGKGLAPRDATARVDGRGTVEIDVELLARGERWLGPTLVTTRGPLGLVADETRVADRTAVLVYPRVGSVVPNPALAGLVQRFGATDRDAFDGLREYTPGDPLRDVHWSSTAKRPPGELVVTEFTGQQEESVTLVAQGDAGHADEMAAAAASLALHVLDAGLAVEVVAPDGRVPEGRGELQRERVLGLLARTSGGRVADRAGADLDVFAGREGVTVRVGESTFSFDDVTAGASPGAGVVA